MNDLTDAGLRNIPSQARSRQRVQRLLDAAADVLAKQGAAALTTTRIAQVARVPVGSVYHYFPDKKTIVDALAVRYWSDFDDLVAGLADADEREPLDDPVGAILETLAAGFRSNPGFLALWYGDLRTQRVRDATRVARIAFGGSVVRILAVHWPESSAKLREAAARMVVLAGDGMLREAFRLQPEGDEQLLAESKRMLDAYLDARLGERAN